MLSPTPTIKKVLDQNKDNASSDLLIKFPSGTQIPTPATKANKPSTACQPTFSLAQSCLRTHVPGAKYIAVSLDLDAPSPFLPLAAPILHYLHTDLVAAVTSPFAAPPRSSPIYKTDTATETWVQLMPTSVAVGGRGTLERPLASWLAPAPPGFSAPHRYMFLVWEQPKRVSGDQVRAKLGLDEGEGEAGLWGRSWFDVEGFVEKLKLGEIVAGTWMVVGN